MSLFGDIFEGLFGVGGDPQIPEVEWDEIKKLLEFGIDKNRYDQRGLFTSNLWDKDKGTLTTEVSDDIRPGYEALLSRVNQGTQGYPRAGAMSRLLDAMNFGQQPERRPPPQRRPFTPPERPEGFPSAYREYGGY